jgi:succinoglycan biosynthesis transport protein ExoP
MVAEWKEKIEEERKKLKGRPDLAAANAESEIKLVDGEIKRQQEQLAASEKQIADVMQRVNNVPGAVVALGALDGEYKTKKDNYDMLLAQQSRISLSAEADRQQQGQGIQVVDRANLPSVPMAPKRWTLSGLGLAIGLGVGFFLAGLVEIPKLLTIQTTEDAAHYTGLPVLVSVPELLTPKEARARPLRRTLLLAAGIVATVVSTPALALLLKATHIFDRFVG